MRLWHEALIPYLPRLQLLGQNRETCALRGNGWGKDNYFVNYVFNHNLYQLYHYHTQVMTEMKKRNYTVHNSKWFLPYYRGKKCKELSGIVMNMINNFVSYPEHNDEYLTECLNNLKYGVNDKGEIKNIDLFHHFPNIEDKGCYDVKKWKEFFIKVQNDR